MMVHGTAAGAACRVKADAVNILATRLRQRHLVSQRFRQMADLRQSKKWFEKETSTSSFFPHSTKVHPVLRVPVHFIKTVTTDTR